MIKLKSVDRKHSQDKTMEMDGMVRWMIMFRIPSRHFNPAPGSGHRSPGFAVVLQSSLAAEVCLTLDSNLTSASRDPKPLALEQIRGGQEGLPFKQSAEVKHLS